MIELLDGRRGRFALCREPVGQVTRPVDRERAAFIKQYFHADWPNRSLYHAMISTDEGQERAIQVILGFLRKEIASSA